MHAEFDHKWYYLGLNYFVNSNNFFKNSKVFEQKGSFLNFKANIDPKIVKN